MVVCPLKQHFERLDQGGGGGGGKQSRVTSSAVELKDPMDGA